MGDVIRETQTWTYYCKRCGHVAAREFEVSRTSDRHGGEVVAWRRGGHPCVTPWAAPVCPDCGGHRVKVLPAGGGHGT